MNPVEFARTSYIRVQVQTSRIAVRRGRLALVLAAGIAPSTAACTNFGDLQKGEAEPVFAFDGSYLSTGDAGTSRFGDASVWTYVPLDASTDAWSDGGDAGDAAGSDGAAAADVSTGATASDATTTAPVPTTAVTTADAAIGACKPGAPGCPGTPTGVTLSGVDLETGVGGSIGGGSPVDDACAGNEVVIGYNVTSSPPNVPWIQSAQALCGTLSVTGSAPSYTVGVAPAEALTAHGSTGSVTQTATCPAGQMVVGFGGRAGYFIDELALVCAPLTIALTPSGYELSVGPTAAAAALGGSGGSPFPSTSCPTGQVAAGDFGSAGSELDAFGLKCRIPVLATSAGN